MTTFTKYVLLLLSCGYFLCQFTVEGKVFSRSLFAKEHQHVSLDAGDHEDTEFALGSLNKKIQEATEQNRKRRSAGGHVKRAAKQPSITRAILPNSDRSHNEAIVHWSGKNSTTMFILTRQHFGLDGEVTSSSLYRSTNYGSSFERVTSLPKDALIHYFFVCPNNAKQLLFTDRANKTLYITTDEAETFNISNLDFSPDRFVFHPSLQNTVLGYAYDTQSLYASDDLGVTWTLVNKFVNSRFYWAIKGVDNDTRVIHMEVQDARLGGYVYMACARPYCKDVTVDKSLGTIDYDTLLLSDEYIFVQKTTQFASHLYVSFRRSQFQRAYFPRKYHPKDFSIVSTDDQQVFIAGNHRSGVVNLYVSDTTGHFYVSSLQRVLALKLNDGTFHADLYEVRGMKGTYIVNQQTRTKMHIRTLITFDQGGVWSPIPAPQKDYKGKTLTCKQVNCSLHLHMKLSSFYFGIPIILSEDNAPGLIMAQGVMGTYLMPHKSSLFLSRDGGFSWTLQFDGNHTHNILDQGGAMVAIKEQSHNLVNTIMYSCTEGATWTPYTFTAGNFFVDGVLNEPGINTLIVSIFGRLAKNASWTIIKVDFSPVLSSQCEPGDYENWTPTDQHISGKCILGQKLTYKRRKQKTECSNGKDYEKAVSTTLCTCTKDDYVCDYGYEQQGSKCVAAKWFDASVPLVNCPEGATYSKTKGYRKVAADKCTTDKKDFVKKYRPTVVNCPVVKPGGLDVTMSSKQAAIPKKPVVFHLTQETGSKISTSYRWDFSSDIHSDKVTVKGFNKARNHTKSFEHRGLHTVTVTATNSQGSAKTSLTFMVEDRIRGVYVVTPHGAQVNRKVEFDLEVISDSYDAMGMGHVHFIWTFGDETWSPSFKPLLTWESHVTHVYTAARNYSVSVEAVNGVSSYFWTFTLPVYEKLVTVQLVFAEDKDNVMVKEDTPMWRRRLDDALRRALADRMFVSEQKLEVVTVRLAPLTVDVSILPSSFNSQMSQLAAQLVAATTSGTVVLTLDPRLFGISNITAVSAAIVSDKDLAPHKGRSYIALYICLPILLVAVFISVLIGIYYKKKLTSLRRYRILGEPGGPDSLLDGTDDDDDDPLLDSELSETGHRLALSEDADDPLGAQMIGMGDERSPASC